jgi:hypothetical protein
MRPTPPLLVLLAMLAPRVAAANPCEAEVTDLAGKVTRLENLVAADRAVVNSAETSGRQGALVLDALRQKLQDDERELQLAWQRLLESQERCNRLIAEESRIARADATAVVALDVKAAYAIPVGNVWGSSPWNPALPMSAQWTGAVPLEVAARYRFTPGISAGAYFQWGPALVTSTGPDGIAGGSGYDMRLGVEAVYDFAPGTLLDPWISLGTGWGWSQYSGTTGGGNDASITMSGWEYLNFQAGLDFSLAPGFDLGPYMGFVAGSYTNIVATGASQGWGGAIPTDARAFHAWIQFGAKGTAKF